MQRRKSHSMYRALIVRITVFLAVPFFVITEFVFFRVMKEGMQNYRAGVEQTVEQGRTVREMHIRNVYSIVNRICTDSSLSGFLLVDYTNRNPQYYRSQMAAVLSSDSVENYGYTIGLFYTNTTIPRGFGSFFLLSDLDMGRTSEFIASPDTERWVLPCDAEGYEGNFTPYAKNYTYLRKVLIDDRLLYILAVSVPEREMDSFLRGQADFSSRLPDAAKITQTSSFYIVNYDVSQKFGELQEEALSKELERLSESGSIVERVSFRGFPQELIYVYPPNPHYGMLVVITCLSVLFVILLVYVVMRFVKKMWSSMYACLEEFDASIANGFCNKLPLRGDDEITQMARAFNAQIEKIQALLTLTAEQACLVKDSQIMALQQQINPHFLYNTLEVFSYKMELYRHYEEADAMVAFSNMLRYNTAGRERFSSLRMELEQVENYMCIQRLKYSGISFEVEIPSLLHDQQLPRFLLQPVIENCFTHGYYGEPMHIILSAAWEGDFVNFCVADNGKGMMPEELKSVNDMFSGREREKSGIGLSNINARLRLFYSDECSLGIRCEEGWTAVAWKVPRRRFRAEEEEER